VADDPADPNEAAVGAEAAATSGLPKRLSAMIALVRAKMRDYPELNRLVEGHETSDRQIAFALAETVDDFNMTPPLIGNYSIENFPSTSLLLRGAIIAILESVGLLQTRNQMNYSDGQGVQVGVSDKAPMLMSWLNMFVSSYEQKKFRLKQALNLNSALTGSGVPSEYAVVNGYFDDL
jgi:hypothetical protein